MFFRYKVDLWRAEVEEVEGGDYGNISYVEFIEFNFLLKTSWRGT